MPGKFVQNERAAWNRGVKQKKKRFIAHGGKQLYKNLHIRMRRRGGGKGDNVFTTPDSRSTHIPAQKIAKGALKLKGTRET